MCSLRQYTVKMFYRNTVFGARLCLERGGKTKAVSVGRLYPGKVLADIKRDVEFRKVRIGFAHILVYRFVCCERLKPLGKVGFHGGCVGDTKVFHSPIQHSSKFFIQGNRKDLLDGLQQSAICDRM